MEMEVVRQEGKLKGAKTKNGDKTWEGASLVKVLLL